ncbi:MAG: family permease [Flaviaesturariibacter sp.]|nr:family permease [Flaviaesturariibacter sp.]
MTARPKLKLFDFTMIVISLVIGMGIFRTPVNVAKDAPSTFVFFAAWIAGGLVALCGALTYAEIGSRLPVTGGYYKIFSYAYHPSIAFGVNCLILVSNAASLAGVAIIGGEYITGVFVPAMKDAAYMQVAANQQYIRMVQMAIAIAAIVIFYGVNLLGLKMSARTQSILMMVKIVLILLLIAPLFFATGADVVTPVISTISPTMNEYVKAFGIGLVAVSFTYGGYQQTINFGGEVDRKNISRGIFLGISAIIILYLTINYAYIKVIGFEQLKTSTNIAAIMASKIFGPNAERVLSVFLFLSVLAYVNVLLMSNPRVMYAMSEDRILPPAFQKRNAKTGALVISLTVFASLCALIVFWAEEFDTILSFSIFLDCFGMILSAGSIFILRKKTAHLNGTGIYQMKLYPLLPIIFILAYVFVALSLLVNETKLSLIGIGVLAAFVLLYFLLAKPTTTDNARTQEETPAS